MVSINRNTHTHTGGFQGQMRSLLNPAVGVLRLVPRHEHSGSDDDARRHKNSMT